MRDWRVVVLSFLGLICIGLTFAFSWYFIIGAAVFSGWGWRILLRKK